MDEELFTEPNDNLKKMINEAVEEHFNTEEKVSDGMESFIELTNDFVKRFRKAGYSRKEAVYLAGQLSNAYLGGICGLVGGMLG